MDPFQDVTLKTVFGIDDLWNQELRNVGTPFIREIFLTFGKGPFLYYVRTLGWVGGPENGNFPLLYVVKMPLRRWVGGSKKSQNNLT